MNQEYIIIKIMLTGNRGAGKKSLQCRYCEHKESDSDTIGIDFTTINIVQNNKLIRIQIWKQAGGQANINYTLSCYYRNAYTAIILYDINDALSFKSINKYIAEV